MRQKVIFAMREHDPREVPHEWFWMHVELSECIVDAPAANQLDDVAVESREKEGHRNSSAEVSSGNVLGFES